MKHTTFNWRTSKSLDIFAQLWEPETTKAVICLVHGMGEHSSRYHHLAEFFNQHNYAVISFDQIGHGKSDGSRGHADQLDQLLNQVEKLTNEASKRFPAKPQFIYGHSMGGNLVINYALRRNPKQVGFIVSAPWLQLAFQPPKVMLNVAKVVNNFWGGLTQPSNLNAAHLSHDTEVVKEYQTDPLVHDKISTRMFFSIHQAGEWALKNTHKLLKPMLLMHGTEDMITSYEASRQFAEKTGELLTFVPFSGMYHEIHNEPNKNEVFQTTLDWMENKLNARLIG